MGFTLRTHTCGELRKIHGGLEITLNGWVHVVRSFGGIFFIDIRDRYGITQIVVEPSSGEELLTIAKSLRSEYVVSISGTVRERENPNSHIPTGSIEIVVKHIELINKAELPPFEIAEHDESGSVGEELRLKYRYLDLRRQRLMKNFIIRNTAYQIAHQFFYDQNFLEIETPVLMKSTPEGARDFLVPSRINKGKFYALPQSPQLYKQILMVAGFDRYMQIVKCFRDEDLRADRQPEFTQIDVEMSFVGQEEILTLVEAFVETMWKQVLDIPVQKSFPRMSWNTAMVRYGSDKPDVRYGLEITTLNSIVEGCGFSVFTDTLNKEHGIVAGINAKGCAGFSRKQIDEIVEHAKKYGAKGLSWIKFSDDSVSSPIAKFLSEEVLTAIKNETLAENGDLILIAADDFERCYTILGQVRTEIAKRSGVLAAVANEFAFLWITEFPLMEFNEEEQRYIARHHPFTAPMDEDIELLDSDPTKARAKAHDLVCNGYEIAGGSIRIHDSSIQQKMFDLLGFTREDADSKFGFLLDALKYGAPLHGGIALGFDRWIMLLAGTDNIRDVIAFPKTTSGLSLMDGSPSVVDVQQLKELALSLVVPDSTKN